MPMVTQILALLLILLAGIAALGAAGNLPKSDRLSKATWNRALFVILVLTFLNGVGVLYFGKKESAASAESMKRLSSENEEWFTLITQSISGADLERLGNDGDVALKRAVERVPKKLAFWWSVTGDSGRLLSYLTEQARDVNPAEVVTRNEEIAAIAMHAGELDVAESALNRVFEASSTSLAGWQMRGALHLERSEYREAESCYKQLAALLKNSNRPMADGPAHNNLAVVYSRWSPPRWDEARAEVQEALAIYESRNLDLGRAIAYGRLGIIERSVGNLDLALEYHRKAMDIYKALDDDEGQARELSGIALIHLGRGEGDDLELAEENLNKALLIEKRILRPLGVAKDMHNLGVVKLYQGELVEAERVLRDAVVRLRRLQNPEGTAKARLALGKVLAKRQDVPQAIRELTKARDLFTEIGSSSVAQAVEKLIAQLEEEAEQPTATQPTSAPSGDP